MTRCRFVPSYHGNVAEEVYIVEALGVFQRSCCEFLRLQNSMVDDYAVNFSK